MSAGKVVAGLAAAGAVALGLFVFKDTIISTLMPAKGEAPPSGTPIGTGTFRAVFDSYVSLGTYKYKLYRNDTELVNETINIVVINWTFNRKDVDITQVITNNRVSVDARSNGPVQITFLRSATGETLSFDCQGGFSTPTGG